MTEEEKLELEELEILLSQNLFHVMSDDVNSETGAKIEEEILAEFLAHNPSALKYKPMKQWVEETVGKCYMEDVKRQNEEYLKKQEEQKNL